MISCDVYVSRCLAGSGASLDGVITDLMAGQFQEVRDSLRAVGFSEQVKGRCVYKLHC